jgi:hypothetical protein
MSKAEFIQSEIKSMKELLKQENISALDALFDKSENNDLEQICNTIYNYIHPHKNNIKVYLVEEIAKYNMLISLSGVNEDIVHIKDEVIDQIVKHLENIIKQLCPEEEEVVEDID